MTKRSSKSSSDSRDIYKQRGEDDSPYVGETRMSKQDIHESIIRSYLEDGLTIPEVADRLALHPGTVRAVLEKTKLKRKAARIEEEVREAVFTKSVPVLRAIGDMGLVALFEWVSNFVRTNRHLNMTTLESQQLTGLLEKLHTMTRLELGKSTSNIAMAGRIDVAAKSLNEILTLLKKPPEEGGDPFVSYHQPDPATLALDAPPEKVNFAIEAEKVPVQLDPD